MRLEIDGTATKSECDAIEREMERRIDLLDDVRIENQSQLDSANRYIQDCARTIKTIEARRTAITKPINRAKREIDELFVPARKACERVQAILKSAVERYLDAHEDKVLEAMDAGELPLVAPPKLSSGVCTRRQVTWQVEDLDAVPREYLEIAVSQVDAAVKAGAKIPGIRVRVVNKVLVRT